MTDEEVTITKGQYKHLLECEEQAEKCGGCGPLAQRDRIIENLKKNLQDSADLISNIRRSIESNDDATIVLNEIKKYQERMRSIVKNVI